MTSGEGGMVSCSDAGLARQVRLLRNQGMERQYENEVVGLNNRMTDIHAAIGRVQLTKVAGWTTQRQANAAYFDSQLRGVVTPPVAAGAVHVYHQYTIRIEAGDDGAARTEVARRLREDHGIGTGVYYPIPNHRLATFARDLDLPVTEKAAREVLSLPVHPSLTAADLEHIVSSVNAVVGAVVGAAA
jgi:dTDP-4-amino-4,6-dideoxygalactose transaminase